MPLIRLYSIYKEPVYINPALIMCVNAQKPDKYPDEKRQVYHIVFPINEEPLKNIMPLYVDEAYKAIGVDPKEFIEKYAPKLPAKEHENFLVGKFFHAFEQK